MSLFNYSKFRIRVKKTNLKNCSAAKPCNFELRNQSFEQKLICERFEPRSHFKSRLSFEFDRLGERSPE